MSDQVMRLVAAGVLLAHGLGHGGALGALVWIGLRPGDSTGGWLAARTWLVPSLPSAAATMVASAFWILSLLGFVVAAAAFWLGLGEWWRALAAASALISLAGIVLFFGTWPTFNTVAALAVNVGVLIGLLWLRWPPQTA